MSVMSLAVESDAGGLVDWVVGGSPLSVWAERWTDVVPTPKPNGWLAAAQPHEARRLRYTRAEPVLSSGRIPLYVCSECRDATCGVFAVRVVIEAETVRWRDFAWDRDTRPPAYTPEPADMPEIAFGAADYRAVLDNLIGRRLNKTAR